MSHVTLSFIVGFLVITAIPVAIISGQKVGVFKPSNPLAILIFPIWLTTDTIVRAFSYLRTRYRMIVARLEGRRFQITFLPGTESINRRKPSFPITESGS